MSTDVTNSLMWWLALIIGMLGIIGHFITIPVITSFAFWLVVPGFLMFLIMPVLDETMHT